MKIIIDTDKKSIIVPNDLKKAYTLLKTDKPILSLIDMEGYSVKVESTNNNADRLNMKDIETYMATIKDTDKAKFEEYTKLKNNKTGVSKNGKPIKTNFLFIKKWFYDNFPDQKSNKSK